MLADAIEQLSDPDGASSYLRLSTRPIDQAPFGAMLDRYGEPSLRRLVTGGGYRLIDGVDDGRPAVTIVTTGPTAPEALEAARAERSVGV